MGRSGRRPALWIGALGFMLCSIALWAGPFTPVQVGTLIFAPLVALLGFELGVRIGIAAALVALFLSLAALHSDGRTIDVVVVIARAIPLLALGIGGARLGVRIRSGELAALGSSGSAHRDRAMYIKAPEDDRILYVDPQLEQITGYPPAAWLGTGMLERVIHPEDRERVLGELASAHETGAPLSIVYRMIGHDGSTVWVRDASEIVEGRGVRRRRGFLYEITARREAEISRERQSRLAVGLIDGALDGMTLTDREGHVLLANTKMRRMARGLGLPEEESTEEEFAGARLRALGEHLLDPADLAAIERIVDEPDERMAHEFELADIDRSFEGLVSPIETADGEYLGRVWTLRDTTGERTLERLRHDFTTSVSHELRTPLTSILGYLELLQESLGELDQKPDHYIEVITRNAHRLLHLVNDLLFVAQIQAGSFEVELAVLDPTDVIRAAVDSVRPAAAAKRIELSFEPGRPHEILADPIRLGQALDNLIANAIKFTPAGGQVTVGFDAADGNSTITVKDTGIGVPETEQSRLFERFFRSSNASEHGKPGSGLGLTIVQAIVDAHGGSIDLESSPDEGTTVRITIPLAEVVSGSEAPAAERVQP